MRLVAAMSRQLTYCDRIGVRAPNWLVTAVLSGTLLLGAVPAVAQTTGTLRGTVTSDGQPVPAATVTIKGSQLGAVTDGDGNYTLPSVPAGTHTVTFAAPGYKSVSVSVTIQPQATTTRNVELSQSVLLLEAVVVTGSTDQLEVKNSTATRVDRLNNVTFPPVVTDSTASLIATERISENFLAATLGVVVQVGPPKFRTQFSAAAGTGTQDIILEKRSGAGRTEYSATNYQGVIGAASIFEFERSKRQQFTVSYSHAAGDATRDPATTAPGGSVSAAHRITVDRFQAGTTFVYSAGGPSYFAGVEYFLFKYKIDSEYDVDFSTTVPGASSHVQGQSTFEKSGVRAIAGAGYSFNNVSTNLTGRIGNQSRSVTLQLTWTLK